MTTLIGLNALAVEHAESSKAHAESLRDQIRVRIHVYDRVAKTLPVRNKVFVIS